MAEEDEGLGVATLGKSLFSALKCLKTIQRSNEAVRHEVDKEADMRRAIPGQNPANFPKGMSSIQAPEDVAMS